MEANQLDSTDLDTNAKVVIPLAPNQHHAGDNATFARRITRYKVRRGDTVQSVAENFGVPAQMLRRWNGLRSDSLHGRTVLARKPKRRICFRNHDHLGNTLAQTGSNRQRKACFW